MLGTDWLSLMLLVLAVVREAIGECRPGLGQMSSNRALGDSEDLSDVRSRSILEVVQSHDLRLFAGKPSYQPPELGEVLRRPVFPLAAVASAPQEAMVGHRGPRSRLAA